LVLSALFLSAISLSPIQAQSSQATSEIAAPLWKVLLQSTADLPAQIDLLTTSSQTQIDLLEVNNSQLLTSNADLLTSNSGLQDSNRLLMQQNVDLATSLQASQAALAISEQLRSQLETQLNASISYIKQAQVDAKTIAFQNGLLKVGLYVAVPVTIDFGVKMITGKDIVEWVISLFNH
jgi:hypothetical protein